MSGPPLDGGNSSLAPNFRKLFPSPSRLKCKYIHPWDSDRKKAAEFCKLQKNCRRKSNCENIWTRKKHGLHTILFHLTKYWMRLKLLLESYKSIQNQHCLFSRLFMSKTPTMWSCSLVEWLRTFLPWTTDTQCAPYKLLASLSQASTLSWLANKTAV